MTPINRICMYLGSVNSIDEHESCRPLLTKSIRKVNLDKYHFAHSNYASIDSLDYKLLFLSYYT